MKRRQQRPETPSRTEEPKHDERCQIEKVVKMSLGKSNPGAGGYSIEKPTPPDFEKFKKVQPPEDEVKYFWLKYENDVTMYNLSVIEYWVLIFKEKRRQQREQKKRGTVVENGNGDYPTSLVNANANDTSWNSRLTELVRTFFETNTFLINRHEFSEWYQPTYFDLSGPLGTLDYWKRDDEEDIFKPNEDGSFQFDDVIFNLSVFNFFERNMKFKHILSSGHRIKFSKENIEDRTFKIVAQPCARKTRVSIQFQTPTDYRKRALNFIFSDKIELEKVSCYPFYNDEGWTEFIIDIPIPPRVVSSIEFSNANPTFKKQELSVLGPLYHSDDDDEEEDTRIITVEANCQTLRTVSERGYTWIM